VLLTAGLASAALYALFSQIIMAGIMAYDGFWHLLVGKMIFESGSVPRADFFCFTAHGLDWVNLNWLAQLIAYRLYLYGGYDGPLLLSGVLFTVGLIGALIHASRRGALALPSLMAAALCFFAMWLPYGIRPRMWTFALTATLAALLAPRGGEVAPTMRWRLTRAGVAVLLLWLWNNLHGGFVYGYGLLGFVWLGERIDAVRSAGLRTTLTSPASYVLPIAILLGFVGFLFHPHGLAALQHALGYTNRFHPEVWVICAEIAPYEFTGFLGWFLIGYLSLALGGVLLARRSLRFADLVPALIFLVLTLRVRRGLTPFLLISAPWVAQLWSTVLRERLRPRPLALMELLKPAVARLPALLGLGVVAYVPFGAATAFPYPPGSLEGAPTYRNQLPSEAVSVIRDLPLEGRIFNQYELGGIIAWGLHPGERVFIDGRMDLHCKGESWLDYLTILRLEPGWEQLLDRHDIDLVLLRRGERLLEVLARGRSWRVAYAGEAFVLLARPRG
jgi:hypothetical protein